MVLLVNKSPHFIEFGGCSTSPYQGKLYHNTFMMNSTKAKDSDKASGEINHFIF